MHSSTSSSELTRPGRAFPRALAAAVAVVLAVEIALRLLPAPTFTGYGQGLGSYYEIRHAIETDGPAGVAVVGSSRGRESLVMPDLAERLASAGSGALRVGNYSCPDAKADEILLITRMLTAGDARPRAIVYFVSPRILHGETLSEQRREIFGVFPDQYGAEPEHWLASLSEKPLWDLRNVLHRHYFTFRYRHWIRNNLVAAIRGRTPTSPVRGGFTNWQLNAPGRSLVNRPVGRAQIDAYVNRLLDAEGRYAMGGIRVDALRETIRLCREQEVPLLLVAAPIAPDLMEAYPDGLYGGFLGILAQLQEEEGVSFHTLEELGVELGREHFREQSHLNRAGAEILTRAVTDRLLAPTIGAG